MRYNYFCEDKECTIGDYKESDADGFVVVIAHADDFKNVLLVWEENHGMMESPDVRCPACGGKATKYLAFNHGGWYIRGNYLLDKAGCRRQMALHHLDNKDEDGQALNPYDEHYEPGEKDHIRGMLKRGGKPAPMITSVHEQKKQVNTAREKYVESVLEYLDKIKTEIEVYWD